MKQVTVHLRITKLFSVLCMIILLSNCSNIDETTITEVEIGKPVTDAWICIFKSFEEDNRRYELHMEDNGDYLAISDSRILKLSQDGILNSMTPISQPDDNHYILRVFDGKIYRFNAIDDIQNYDSTKNVEFKVYDFDFNLLNEQVLATTGLIYDVEIEDEEVFSMLVYFPDEFAMKLKRVSISDGVLAETVLSTNGTNPTNLHILDSGKYLCTDNSTLNHLHFLDKDLNIVWEEEIEDVLINDAAYIDGKGIYIYGRKFHQNFENKSFVALLDMNGNLINNITLDQGDRSSPYMGVNGERIFILQIEPGTALNMVLNVLDLDLNIEKTFQIPGRMVISDIINNDNESFSFIYGVAEDLNNTDWNGPSNTRLFKFNDTYTVPTNIIIQ